MKRRITKTIVAAMLLAMSSLVAVPSMVFAEETEAGEASLYDRLGGWEGIDKVVHDTIARHHDNPLIAHYFVEIDDEELAAHVTAFFAAGTGGPAKYEGRDMTSAHAGMKLTDAEYDSAVKDVLDAARENGLGATELGEVAAILEALRPAVMGNT